MELVGWIGVVLLLVLVLGGVPLAFSFIAAAFVIGMFAMNLPLTAIGHLTFESVNSYPLLAAPFFVLAGNLLVQGGALDVLRGLLRALVGNTTGGLPIAAIFLSAVLGAISGSAAACLAILAALMIPIFTSMNYERRFTAGLLVTSAELGLIVPPSIFLILFGAFNRVSIIELFAAGMAAGLLIAILMAITAVLISRKRGYSKMPVLKSGERRKAIQEALPLIGFPVLVLGGIYGGLFSPTESASVAVFYALVLGTAVYRKLTWPGFAEALVKTAKTTGIIYFLVVGADLLARTVGYLEVHTLITNLISDLDLSALGFLLVVNALLLVVGLFFSSLPMVIVILPLFLPAAVALGIDPVLYGVLGVICASIGEITPPFGPQLWLAQPLCGVRMGEILREASGFLLAWLVAVVLITLFPAIILFPVELLR